MSQMLATIIGAILATLIGFYAGTLYMEKKYTGRLDSIEAAYQENLELLNEQVEAAHRRTDQLREKVNEFFESYPHP